jgi:type VI secretion system protein
MVRPVLARRPVRGKAALALVWLLLLGSVSCGLPRRVRSMFGGQLPLQISVSPEANRNSPIAVELVIAYQGKLLDELLKMPAGDWFRKREQFLRDHPGGVDTWKWEWVPGQEVPAMEISYRVGAKGGVLFADYATPGDHRARIDPHQPVRLVLNPTDFTVEGPR